MESEDRLDQALPATPPGPLEYDLTKVVDEIKLWINKKKYDLIDHGDSETAVIQTYPPRNDESYPETKRFCDQYEATADWLELVGGGSDPEAMLQSFRQAFKDMEDAVNRDEKFWVALRDEVLPLYTTMKMSRDENGGLAILPVVSEGWQKRWSKIVVGYDLEPMTVKTTQMWANKQTNTYKRGNVVHEHTMPAGMVIDIE